MPDTRLDELAERLEQAATQLRAGDLSPERAAAIVEACAQVAAEASAELDRRLHPAGGDELSGQLPLNP